jgi:hypothetical protein
LGRVEEDAGWRKLDAGYWMLDNRFWILILDAGLVEFRSARLVIE